VSVYNASVLGLVTLLNNIFSDDGICLSIFASLATDGASVLTGRYNGVAVQLVQAWIFFMLVCHCVAHRHSLACEDAASENESAVYSNVLLNSSKNEEEEEPEKSVLSEEDILSQVGPFQVPQQPLSILGRDQQNLEKNLSDFKWAGQRLAHVFADGRSTASHKRKMTLLEAPTGTLLFYCNEIKHEIVHTSLLEEYGVSKKWVVIMDKRQDKTAASTQAETSGSSAQDRYCARGSGGGAKKRHGDKDD